MKHIARIMSFVILFCFAGQGNDNLPGWKKLERQGDLYRLEFGFSAVSNKVALQRSMVHATGLNKWFCDVISYNVPTNEINNYVVLLNRKIKLLQDFLFVMNYDDSLDVYCRFVECLARLKRERGTGDSRSYLESHKNCWNKKQAVSTYDMHKAWRQCYHKDKKLRTALGRAITDMESMIERLYDCSSPERKKILLDKAIEITGETPKWCQKELDEKLK